MTMASLPAVEACRTTVAGDFVRLRPLRPEDAEFSLAWRLSPRAFLLTRGSETVEQQRAWIASRPPYELNYVIETLHHIPVGLLSLVNIDLANRRAESARFLIGDEDAARGIPAAVEAMKLLYTLAFDKIGLRKVYGIIFEDNALMIKWQLYLGMKEEGRLREHIFINGRFQDVVCLGLLEAEYRQTTLPRMNGLIAMAKR
jgi:diamine N-acetyltransferase